MRTLKPGPRPFLAMGTICALLGLFPLSVGIHTGKWVEAGKMAGAFLILPAILFGPFVSTRIEVDDTEIRLRNFGLVARRARFDEIEFSIPRILAEKDWPISLTIFGGDDQRERMVINMKILRKEDVAWLLALPQLKVRPAKRAF
jgi:hypothetical protein